MRGVQQCAAAAPDRALIRRPTTPQIYLPIHRIVAASLLAKVSVYPPSSKRLKRRFREQAHSHRDVFAARNAVSARRNLSAETRIVGASLLAKGAVHPPDSQRLSCSLHEQAHSHRDVLLQESAMSGRRRSLCRHVDRGSELAREGSVHPPSSKRLKCRFREQAHSHRMCFATRKRDVRARRNLSADTWIVGASLLAKGAVHPPDSQRLSCSLREQAHSHRMCFATRKRDVRTPQISLPTRGSWERACSRRRRYIRQSLSC